MLKPGGYAALSVWGRQENTQTFTIIGQCLKVLALRTAPLLLTREQQLDIPSIAAPRRSNFHLNNPTELRDMALKAGFLQAVTYWTSTYES